MNSPKDNEKFPLVKLSGTPQEIGTQHGTILKSRIHKTISFYKKIFKLSEEEIFTLAQQFQKNIQKVFPHYAEEIEAIADAADVNPLWIYALNARTEIMSYSPECSTVYFSKTNLPAENWDWAQELEHLAVIMQIKQKNNMVLMVTEPGIIGKIGMNNSGLGVCLNFHDTQEKLNGIPIHIMLRAILDCTSLVQTKKLVLLNATGKASFILAADDNHNSLQLEFTSSGVTFLPFKEIQFHTNHYINNPEQGVKDKMDIASSLERLKRLQEIEIKEQSLSEMKTLLADTKCALPIQRHFIKDEDIGSLGTVCTIIMDLTNREMHITKGNPKENQFEIVKME